MSDELEKKFADLTAQMNGLLLEMKEKKAQKEKEEKAEEERKRMEEAKKSNDGGESQKKENVCGSMGAEGSTKSAEEEARKRMEEENRKNAEEEGRRRMEEESKRKAEEEARSRLVEKKKKKDEEEARRRMEEDNRKNAEEKERKRLENEQNEGSSNKRNEFKVPKMVFKSVPDIAVPQVAPMNSPGGGMFGRSGGAGMFGRSGGAGIFGRSTGGRGGAASASSSRQMNVRMAYEDNKPGENLYAGCSGDDVARAAVPTNPQGAQNFWNGQMDDCVKFLKADGKKVFIEFENLSWTEAYAPAPQAEAAFILKNNRAGRSLRWYMLSATFMEGVFAEEALFRRFLNDVRMFKVDGAYSTGALLQLLDCATAAEDVDLMNVEGYEGSVLDVLNALGPNVKNVVIGTKAFRHSGYTNGIIGVTAWLEQKNRPNMESITVFTAGVCSPEILKTLMSSLIAVKEENVDVRIVTNAPLYAEIGKEMMDGFGFVYKGVDMYYRDGFNVYDVIANAKHRIHLAFFLRKS